MSAKLKLIERSLGLAPKQYQPMSQRMERIARQQDRAQAPAPVPDHGLGATIERLICDEVERRVAEAEERARQQRLLDRQFNAPAPRTFEQLPPVQRPPKKPMDFETVWHRDGAGKIVWCETVDERGERFITKVQRDGTGAIVRSRTSVDGESPVLPALGIPFKAEARGYQPKMRKLFGNGEE